jgi:hypothetical protein
LGDASYIQLFGAAAECSTGLLRALAELHFGGQSAETVGAALAWLRERRDWSSRQVFDFLLAAIRPRMGVEKTPETAMSPASMARACRQYANARFLHLTRHPVTSQRSVQSHWQAFWGRRMRKRAGCLRSPTSRALTALLQVNPKGQRPPALAAQQHRFLPEPVPLLRC